MKKQTKIKQNKTNKKKPNPTDKTTKNNKAPLPKHCLCSTTKTYRGILGFNQKRIVKANYV